MSQEPTAVSAQTTEAGVEQASTAYHRCRIPEETPTESGIATYHDVDEPLQCTASVVEEATNDSQVSIEFTLDNAPLTVTRDYDIPSKDTNPEYTATVIEHLGGGEVKCIDGSVAYAIPKQLYTGEYARHSIDKMGQTSMSLPLPQIGTSDNGDWVLVTKQQYETWKADQEKFSAYRTTSALTSVGWILSTTVFTMSIMYSEALYIEPSATAFLLMSIAWLLTTFNANKIESKYAPQ